MSLNGKYNYVVLRKCIGGGYVLPSLSNSANIEATCDVMVQYTLNNSLCVCFGMLGSIKTNLKV